jgi:hypothetical protein
MKLYTAEELIAHLEKTIPEPLHGPKADPEVVLWDRAQRSLIVSIKLEIERQRKPKGSA